MLNFNSILLFSENPKILVDFYKKVLKKDVDWSGGEFSGMQAGNGHLVIGPHDKVHGKSQNPERMIINFEVGNIKEDVKRLQKAGIKKIQDIYHVEEYGYIATFEDIDGNYFQLAQTKSN